MKVRLTLLIAFLLAGSTMMMAQEEAPHHYTVSGGLLGGANYSKFRVTDKPDNIDLKWKWGLAGGLFVNFPISNTFSIEPQALYSQMGGEVEDNITPADNYKQKVDYISVPVLLKFNIGKNFSLFAGPQIDFLMTAKEKPSSGGSWTDNKDDIKSIDYAATGGIQLFPRSPISLYARYIHGFGNLDENDVFSPSKVYNQGIQAVLAAKLFGSKKTKVIPPPPPPPPPPVVEKLDSDGDGVIDDNDKCPNTPAGVAVDANGCPLDSDKDGVPDYLDKCPNTPGGVTVDANGCPQDTDGDNVPDYLDKCPNTPAGVKVDASGCAVDTDGDGIPDFEDKCPTIPGTRENDGCPAIPKFNAGDIQFVTGSAKLTTKATKELDDLVEYLKKYPQINLNVNGHTDNTGSAEVNQKLSEKRAESVKAAIVKKGISASRINAAGFGMDQPVADNNTVAGRAMNRRVEFKFATPTQ